MLGFVIINVLFGGVAGIDGQFLLLPSAVSAVSKVLGRVGLVLLETVSGVTEK